MIPHVHQALAQVRLLRRHGIERQRFRGYSGRARALSGCAALAAAFWISRHPSHGSRYALAVWLSVAALGAALNYGAVLFWFLGEPADEMRAHRLKPAVEVVPALAAGAVLTVAFWRAGAFDYMVPVWMMLFGVANLASRHVLPRAAAWVGLFYLVSGAALLLAAPRTGWSNPWPMGVVFFVGEWLGGMAMHLGRPERPHWATFFGLNAGAAGDEQAAD
jgi:hypothetical protein